MLNSPTHKSLIQKGNESILNCDYGRAIKYFQRALEEVSDPEAIKTIQQSLEISERYLNDESNFNFCSKLTKSPTKFGDVDKEIKWTSTHKLTEYSTINRLKNSFDRSECFGHKKIIDKAICDLIFCRNQYSSNPYVYNQLALYSLQIKDFELCEKSIIKLEEMNYDVSLLKAKYHIGKKNYNSAEKDINKLVEYGDYNCCSLSALLYFFYFGNVSKAFSILNILDEQDGLYPFESTLQFLLYLFTQPELPNTIISSSLFSVYLMNLINGIYSSLAIPILNVPGDLFIPKNVQYSWIRWERNFKIPCNGKLTYPEGFDFQLPNFESLFEIFNKALIIGSFINHTTKNTRQRICIGCGTLQIKSMIQRHNLFDMDIGVSSVIHWIRLYDPLSPIFQRDYTPFVIYFQKNGIQTGPETFYPRVFEMLKTGILENVNPLLFERIQQASTPNELFSIIKSNTLIPIGENVYLFLRYSKHNGIDMGISIPPLSTRFRDEYSLLSSLWSRLMILMNTTPTEEVISEFLNCLFLWYYKFLRFTPYAYHTQTISSILFISLFTEYLQVDITDNLEPPEFIHIEALLSPNFDIFLSQIKRSYPISFEFITTDDLELPDIIELMPTYHHRIQSLLVIDSHEFRSFYIKQLQHIAAQIANYTSDSHLLSG